MRVRSRAQGGVAQRGHLARLEAQDDGLQLDAAGDLDEALATLPIAIARAFRLEPVRARRRDAADRVVLEPVAELRRCGDVADPARDADQAEQETQASERRVARAELVDARGERAGERGSARVPGGAGQRGAVHARREHLRLHRQRHRAERGHAIAVDQLGTGLEPEAAGDLETVVGQPAGALGSGELDVRPDGGDAGRREAQADLLQQHVGRQEVRTVLGVGDPPVEPHGLEPRPGRVRGGIDADEWRRPMHEERAERDHEVVQGGRGLLGDVPADQDHVVRGGIADGAGEDIDPAEGRHLGGERRPGTRTAGRLAEGEGGVGERAPRDGERDDGCRDGEAAGPPHGRGPVATGSTADA